MNPRATVFPLCRHTKTNGRLCKSPARADSAFCHFHQKLNRTRLSTINAGPTLNPHVLHPLQNAHSIQHAIAMVLSALSSNQIRLSQAGKMLYALQLAQTNLRRTSME